jgi:peptide/nickel transport system substrate-binding protein
VEAFARLLDARHATLHRGGGDALQGPRQIDMAKRLLAESAYAGQPIVLVAAQDFPHMKAWEDVTADLLTRLGMKVELAPVDWGTVIARRAQKSPPANGGWHLYLNAIYGVDGVDPMNKLIRANGETVSNGWATIPEVEVGVAAWYDAISFEAEAAAVRRSNKVARDNVVYALLGSYLRHFAWRKGVTGVVQGPLPFFWGVSRSA